MDRVGVEGRGESVWLGWFVHECTERLASMLQRVGESSEAERWRARLPGLRSALSEHAWDGSWYRRGYYDDGTVLGSAHSAPPHIDSIAQSWAAISRAGEPDQVAEALRAADHALVREQERLVLLLAPPFGVGGPDPGYIAAYPPGIRENGGQYTHAAAWLGWAQVAVADGQAAHRIFRLLNPLERTQSPAEVERYRVEPYVIAADVYGRPPFVGRGGWTWYTGAAAWTYRLAVEGLLGLRRRDGALDVSPCLPPDWNGFEADVRLGDGTVHVLVHNRRSGGVARVELDGAPQEHARVEPHGSGRRTLEIWLA
jgi:cyclic beta-1,2-glucan synthetase